MYSLHNCSPQLLAAISKHLDNETLFKLGCTCDRLSYISASNTDILLRHEGVYGKPLSYWKTFIEKTSQHPQCYEYFFKLAGTPEAVLKLIHFDNDRALRYASQKGCLDREAAREAVVRLLLDRGADIHARNDHALRWASLHGYLDIVLLLLNRTYNVGTI